MDTTLIRILTDATGSPLISQALVTLIAAILSYIAGHRRGRSRYRK